MNGVAAAEELEQLLGSASDAGNPAGFAAAVARDDQDEFPTELAAVLRAAGFHLNYLPRSLGGRFTTFADSLTLVRTAARRDLNVMPATMFGITALTCLLLHGSDEQQRKAARVLRHGGAVGFALSEAEHGSDLLANTARLTPEADGGGWTLSGRKWMVGLGQRCELAYVAARTGERGPAAFSAVLLDLPAGSAAGSGLDRGEPVRTTGMRGIDFAHLDFTAFPVPADALVGQTGKALEAAVRAQQIVRVMSTAGSLGCADTALRVTLDFAADRTVGRTPLLQAPYPRRELAVASAALLAADAVALAAARGLHVAPETFSVWGCAAKHVVAEATEDLMGRLSGVLATRSVLRGEGPGAGVFQKARRDAELVRVVDTSALANLRSFAGQLPALAEALAGPASAPADEEALRTVFALDSALPPYEPSRLDLNARGRDLATAGALVVAAGLADGGGGAAPWAGRLAEALRGLGASAGRAGGGPKGAARPEPADLAERFAWLHAASCCLLLWWANQDVPLYGGKPGETGWLEACLAYLLSRAEGVDPRREAEALYPALDVTAGLHRAHQLFSAVPVRLAGGPGTALPSHGR
ncbi:acyl-CoA dehydrogenase family protein [Streptomyces polygonati]|uniref:Acyl-CoA dehydrogenase family protein n=1 Tax=Streptomyces polygonati TaxID=1617087 RepID=A0ABV8HDC4_9ACTN